MKPQKADSDIINRESDNDQISKLNPVMLHNFEDDNLLETLSIPTNYSGPLSQGENTPTTLPTLNQEDAESSISSSKKIRKKRNTYQKIDDDIRLKLLDAVQNGETLKAVAKRCNINYSSAKSILHTYRKEGRILKKSGQDRPFESLYMSQTMQNGQEPLTVPGQQQQFPVMTNPMQNFAPIPQTMTQKLDFSRIESECPMNNNMNTQNSSPTNGLMNNFMTKLNLGGSGNVNNNMPPMPFPQNIMRSQPMQQQPMMNLPQYPMFGSMYPMGNPMQNQMPQMNPMMRPFNPNPQQMPMPMMMQPNNMGSSSEAVPMIPINNFNQNPFARAMNMSPVNAASLSEQLLKTNSPLAQLKNFDNFYMNYSNSPLSGGGRMANDNTDSSAKNLNAPKEFESFSDMVSAMQGFTSNQTEDKFMPQLVRGIPSIGSLEKIDFPPQEFNHNQSSLKALMDQQYIVGDAYKKASYYKDLSPFQKLNPEAGSLPNVKLLNLMG